MLLELPQVESHQSIDGSMVEERAGIHVPQAVEQRERGGRTRTKEEEEEEEEGGGARRYVNNQVVDSR